MKHFVDDLEKIGIFYRDTIKVRHQISRDYISTSSAIAERAVRSTLEGTRANLLQAGLHHGYWPYAAITGASSMVLPQMEQVGTHHGNSVLDLISTLIPCGCKMDYWNGPRKRPKKHMKFDPTSEPGIFLGYIIHPGFHWRKEFAVASLKQLNDASFDELSQY